MVAELLLNSGITRLSPLAIVIGGFALWMVAAAVSIAVARGARALRGRRSRLLLGA